MNTLWWGIVWAALVVAFGIALFWEAPVLVCTTIAWCGGWAANEVVRAQRTGRG